MTLDDNEVDGVSPSKHGRYLCWGCKQVMPEDFAPDYCCDGYMCGCGGGPVDPVCCSKECEEKWLATP